MGRESWHPYVTTGKAPGPVKNACMVPAFSESKLVLFGGHSLDGKVAMAGIYILDLNTQRWQKGADAGRAQARFGMACAAAGDSFVVFGGQSVDRSPNFKPMIIYNFKTKAWGDHFYLDTPPPPPKTTKTQAPAPSTTEATSTTDTRSITTTDSEPSATATPLPVSTPPVPEPEGKTNVAVIGGAVGAAALVSFMLLFIYRRYKKRDDYHGDQYPHDAYQDKDYWDAERIHSRESFDDLQGGPQHAHFPLEAVGHDAGDDMDPYSYSSPASPPYLQQPSAVYSHKSPTLFLSPFSGTSQSPYSDPALTTDFGVMQSLSGDPSYPQNMYQSNEPPQPLVSGLLQGEWEHQQGVYYVSRDVRNQTDSIQDNRFGLIDTFILAKWRSVDFVGDMVVFVKRCKGNIMNQQHTCEIDSGQ
ncbi:hypothetical protein BGZ51_001880 [Haplosporangium sp. Z 767]|nr:hypothetical protein BGZ51_001880 [Haplosporangium sp. Z 767]